METQGMRRLRERAAFLAREQLERDGVVRCEVCRLPPLGSPESSAGMRSFHRALIGSSVDVPLEIACVQNADLFNALVYETDREGGGEGGVRQVEPADILLHMEHTSALPFGALNALNALMGKSYATLNWLTDSKFLRNADTGQLIPNERISDEFRREMMIFKELTLMRKNVLSAPPFAGVLSLLGQDLGGPAESNAKRRRGAGVGGARDGGGDENEDGSMGGGGEDGGGEGGRSSSREGGGGYIGLSGAASEGGGGHITIGGSAELQRRLNAWI